MKRRFQYQYGRFVLLSLSLFSAAGLAASQPSIPTTGTFRALVVFVRFQDDTLDFGTNTPAQAAWQSPDQLPSFSNALLSSAPTPPFLPESLTDYFYMQSNRSFRLYGTTYPEVIAVGNQADYFDQASNSLSRELITDDILAVLDADPDIDLADYDANRDGFLDHLFVIVRRSTMVLCNGGAAVSDLGAFVTSSGFGSNGSIRVSGSISGSFLRYDSMGIIVPQIDLTRLMAHELGHQLWKSSVFYGLHPNRALVNVPAGDTRKLGYGLMVGGSMVRDVRGDALISAAERDLLGWIDCRSLAVDGTVVLGDLYSTSDCLTVTVPGPSVVPYRIYFANRQRVGFFDRMQHVSSTASDHGLMTTGLLATLTRGGRMAVIPADNSLELSVSSQTYDGDMFGPGTGTQLTPWTRPNINGWDTYPEGFALVDENFQAIDNIRYSDGDELAMDYVRDFRSSPTIREDSWMGIETEGYTFEGPVVVTNGASLTVSTSLTFADDLTIETGSTLVIEASAAIDVRGKFAVEAGATLVVRGTVEISGFQEIQIGADIQCEESGQPVCDQHLATSVEEIPNAPGLSVYPNPASSQARIETGTFEPVTVTIYDALGREVGRLFGEGGVLWQPASHIAGGTYLLHIAYGQARTTRTLVLVR
jgi:M6 family metalloprotease-like protein